MTYFILAMLGGRLRLPRPWHAGGQAHPADGTEGTAVSMPDKKGGGDA